MNVIRFLCSDRKMVRISCFSGVCHLQSECFTHWRNHQITHQLRSKVISFISRTFLKRWIKESRSSLGLRINNTLYFISYSWNSFSRQEDRTEYIWYTQEITYRSTLVSSWNTISRVIYAADKE